MTTDKAAPVQQNAAPTGEGDSGEITAGDIVRYVRLLRAGDTPFRHSCADLIKHLWNERVPRPQADALAEALEAVRADYGDHTTTYHVSAKTADKIITALATYYAGRE